jgi:uncharacterized protein YjbI with pentapeptide repeats
MKKVFVIIIMVVATFIWYAFEGKSIRATNASESSFDMPPINFTGANLTGAILGGVSLDGVILCNTTMPDGTINNSSCIN